MKFLSIFALFSINCLGQWSYYNYSGAIHSGERDCYLSSLINKNSNGVTLTTQNVSNTCEIVDLNGWTWQSPQVQPYSTAGMQWASFSFQYGTVEFKAALPSSNTNLWPAVWLLGANCQKQVAFVSHSGNGCPQTAIDPLYEEIDILECGGPVSWCAIHVFGKGTNATCSNPISDTNYHVWNLNWTSTNLIFKVDGNTICSIGNPNLNVGPMYLIIQMQVTSPNTQYLPATLKVSYVKVTDLNGNQIFYDNF